LRRKRGRKEEEEDEEGREGEVRHQRRLRGRVFARRAVGWSEGGRKGGREGGVGC
jgi:hypothetical protein